jgi:hypothetical protein
MTPSISCYYLHYNRQPYNFTFIKFEKFVKVILNTRAVVMTIKQLVENAKLFKIYQLSLLLTNDTEQIFTSVDEFSGDVIYGVMTVWYWKYLRLSGFEEFTALEKSRYKNPFKSCEPKRESSRKKYNKFLKLFNSEDVVNKMKDPDVVVLEFFQKESADIYDYFRRYIEHEKKIEMLSVIMHNYGRDIYKCVKQFV